MIARVLAIALLACAAAACATDRTTHKETLNMNDDDDGPGAPSRGAPPVVTPIENGGVRYQQDMEAGRHGGGGLGGYLVAVDPTSDERLWMVKVYAVTDESAAGVSTPGCYFRHMTLLAGKNVLEIQNEVGGVFRVDLAKRTSTWVSGPDFASH
jgi:hypothetical protein